MHSVDIAYYILYKITTQNVDISEYRYKPEIANSDMLIVSLWLLFIVKSTGEWSTKVRHDVSGQSSGVGPVSSGGISSTGPAAVQLRRHEVVRTRNERGIVADADRQSGFPSSANIRTPPFKPVGHIRYFCT